MIRPSKIVKTNMNSNLRAINFTFLIFHLLILLIPYGADG